MNNFLNTNFWKIAGLGIILAAAMFTYLLPASVLTAEWRIHQVEYDQICTLKEQAAQPGFVIEYQDGRQIKVLRESMDIFLKRTEFNYRPLSNYYTKESAQLYFNNCQNPATAAMDCDPMVKGLNVFYIHGFLKVNAQMFVVIYGDGDFDDCNCSDPKVILGKKPYCKLIYHNTKKSILRRARACGLGDYFPEKSCDQ